MVMLTATSCKRAEAEFTWSSLEGVGSYSSATDTSTIKLSGWIKIEQPAVNKQPFQVTLADWQYTVVAGSAIVMNVKKDGVTQVLGDVTMATSALSFDFLWVEIETTTPKAGDIFYGNNPDLLQFDVLIQDDSGNVYDMAASTPFQFTRD
jgi:hypothetical protein